MRHKYDTRGIVLARTPLGEANALVFVLTPSLGLLRARAQGVRKSGAKLSAALATFAESDLVLVRGKEGWRVSGAVLSDNWFSRMGASGPRRRAARVSGLLLRLVAGEAHEEDLYPIVNGFFATLMSASEESHEDAEALAVLRMLAVLGLDAGEIPGEGSEFGSEFLSVVAEDRPRFVARINAGIAASGL